jgi:predicted nucleic acid-binding protein
MRRHTLYYKVFTQEDYDDFEERINRFKTELRERINININDVEDDRNKLAEVQDLANVIIRRTSSEVMDAVIFASATSCMASELITYDSNFINIVSDGNFRRIFKRDVGRILGLKVADIKLPQAKKL